MGKLLMLILPASVSPSQTLHEIENTGWIHVRTINSTSGAKQQLCPCGLQKHINEPTEVTDMGLTYTEKLFPLFPSKPEFISEISSASDKNSFLSGPETLHPYITSKANSLYSCRGSEAMRNLCSSNANTTVQCEARPYVLHCLPQLGTPSKHRQS